MARTGTFGRTPRAMPSLTNTLIAIAREQEAREDQNIMDAWQKGGTVNGKKVTDSVVLAHWNARLKDISKDDPLYDTYRNAVQQYQYSIAESKMTAAYAQVADPKAGDDAKMAAFYMNWSKKIPKDSEFYRTLLRDAGQFIRSAKAKRDAITKQNAEKDYTTRLDRLEQTNELPGETALRTITLLAQRGSQGSGAVLGESPLGGAGSIVDTTNLPDLQLPGVDQMMALLNTIAPEEAGPNPNGTAGLPGPANTHVLYTDENGKPVTGADLVATFKKLDPTFDGKFSVAYVKGLLVKQRDGIQKRIDLAKKTGHTSDMMQLQMKQAKINEFANEVGALPVAGAYADLHAKKQGILADIKSGKLTPDGATAALNAVNAQIGALANDKRIASDDHLRSQLTGEANNTPGTLTLAEDLAGTHTGYSGSGTSEVDTTKATLDLYQEQRDNVAAGAMVMTQGDYVNGPDGKPKFVPSAQGKSVGAATMSDINNLPGAGKPVPVMVPNGDGGGATPMYVVPAPIMANTTNPDGTPMNATRATPAGSYIRYMVNGKETTLYSIDRGGQTTWTFDPPWDQSKAKMEVTGGVMNVTLYPNGGNPTAGLTEKDYQTDHDLGNGFAIKGSSTNPSTGKITLGHLEFDPTAAMLGTDPPRQVAGHDPYTDSFSASLAAVRTSPDGPALLQQWIGDPRFHMILEQNARLSAGMTLDATTGQWTGGDPNAYAANMATANGDLAHAKTGAQYDSNPNLRDAWWKDDTFTQMTGAPAGTVPGKNGQATVYDQPPAPLPTNVIQNTPGASMQGLATAFKPSGQLSLGKQQDDLAVPGIKMGAALTLPSLTPSATPTAPSVAPTTPYNVPQGGTQNVAPTAATYGQHGK